MRTYFRIAGAAIIALATTWPQFADCQAYSYGSQPKEVQQNRQQAFGTAAQRDRMQKRHDALEALRAEGLKLRDADGGKLTPEHEAYLQTKLNAINADQN
jgi:hypothetical protein